MAERETGGRAWGDSGKEPGLCFLSTRERGILEG